MYFVYLLQSQKDQKFYIGYTQDIKERLKYHNSGRSRFTKNRGPWKLVAFLEFLTRSEAIIEEKRIKSLKNRLAIKETFNLKT